MRERIDQRGRELDAREFASSVGKRGREIPDPRVSRGKAKQCAASRSPSRSEPTTALNSEIPTRDCLSRLHHVAIDELRLAFQLNAAEWRYDLKNDQNATRRPREMPSLDVALGEYDFECVLVEAEPDRSGQRAAVLPVSGEDGRRGRVQQRPHVIERHIETLMRDALLRSFRSYR